MFVIAILVSSYATLNINGVPSGGTFTITPQQGIAENTTFALTASDWTGTKPPLSYSFAVMDQYNNQLTRCSSQSQPTCRCTLPVGSVDRGYAVTVILTVRDSAFTGFETLSFQG